VSSNGIILSLLMDSEPIEDRTLKCV
jgi:hypothetical protein